MPLSTVNLRNLWALGFRLVTVPRVSARERGVPMLEKEIGSEEEVAEDLKVTEQKLETNRNNLISDQS